MSAADYLAGKADARAEDRSAARTAWGSGRDYGHAEALVLVAHDLAKAGHADAARQVEAWTAEMTWLPPVTLDDVLPEDAAAARTLDA